MQAGANLMGGYMKDQANQDYLAALKDIEKIRAGGSGSKRSWVPTGPESFAGPPS